MSPKHQAVSPSKSKAYLPFLEAENDKIISYRTVLSLIPKVSSKVLHLPFDTVAKKTKHFLDYQKDSAELNLSLRRYLLTSVAGYNVITVRASYTETSDLTTNSTSSI